MSGRVVAFAQLFVIDRAKARLMAALAVLAFATNSAHGTFVVRAELATGLDAVLQAVESTFGSGDPADVDLGDGRSRVPARWRPQFERFAQSDREDPPAPGATVFVGSSSIDLWRDLPAQFPDRRVIQRGIGGATMADCARHVDRFVLPYAPRAVVVYAGDNDLALGIAPERVVADADALATRVHRALPSARIVFLSVKPSPSRAGLLPLVRRTNALLAAYAATDPRLAFVDVFASMVGDDDKVRAELFRADGLHMNAAGYAVWRDALVARLD